MKIIFIIITCLFLTSLDAQNYNEVSVENSCDCDILISSEEWLDPFPPPTPIEVTTNSRVIGNLDEFVSYINGECYSTVKVLKRKIINNQIQYKRINTVTNVNHLLKAYRHYNTICFDGEFTFVNGIKVGGNKILKLLSDSELNYRGSGHNAAITFIDDNSGIEGGKITTQVSMNDGLIKIKSESARNVRSIQIKDIVLDNNDVTPYGPNASARDDRAIHMDNPFESLMTQRDYSTNFYVKIHNIDITGFAVGFHARGWSNAISLSDVRFNSIKAYGLWVSGCADNAFSGLNFDDCSNAYGIRIDNSIDDRYSGTMLGDQPITVSDPNKRVEFDTQEIILSLDGAEDQEAFNTSLDNLLNIDQSHDVSLFMALFNACENPTLKLDDNAVFLNSENVNRLNYFGLKGYLVDQNRNPEYVNFKADDKQLDKNNADMFLKSTSTISIFNKTFIHNTELEQITLDKATCLESAGHTMFFKKPTYNSFSNINYIINGVAQVKHVLELRSREDDEDLCMDRADPNEDCEECRYEEHRAHRGSPVLMANAVGVNNVLNLCELPTDPLFVPFKNNYNRNGIIIPNCPDEYNKAIEVNIQN